jgi:hypothetical protein
MRRDDVTNVVSKCVDFLFCNRKIVILAKQICHQICDRCHNRRFVSDFLFFDPPLAIGRAAVEQRVAPALSRYPSDSPLISWHLIRSSALRPRLPDSRPLNIEPGRTLQILSFMFWEGRLIVNTDRGLAPKRRGYLSAPDHIRFTPFPERRRRSRKVIRCSVSATKHSGRRRFDRGRWAFLIAAVGLDRRQNHLIRRLSSRAISGRSSIRNRSYPG